MRWHHISRLCLLIAVLVTQLAGAQPARDNRPRSVQIVGNPFHNNASISTRKMFIDSAFPTLGWATMIRGNVSATEHSSELYKETFARTHQLSGDVVAALDAAMAERERAHSVNYDPLRPLVSLEIDLARSRPVSKELGYAAISEMVPDFVAHSGVSVKEIAELLRVYDLKEGEAEQELIEKLDRLLTPVQLESLALDFLTLDNLHVQLVAHGLGLSEQQREKIETACIERKKFGYEMKEKYPDLFKRNEACLASREWHELNYRALAHLNHRQFQIVAPRVLKPWREKISFTSRLKDLAGAKGLAAENELKVLGDLYRSGAAKENATE